MRLYLIPLVLILTGCVTPFYPPILMHAMYLEQQRPVYQPPQPVYHYQPQQHIVINNNIQAPPPPVIRRTTTVRQIVKETGQVLSENQRVEYIKP